MKMLPDGMLTNSSGGSRKNWEFPLVSAACNAVFDLSSKGGDKEKFASVCPGFSFVSDLRLVVWHSIDVASVITRVYFID